MEWLPSPANLSLSTQEVHVWRVWLDQAESSAEALARTLSADERSRAARFRSSVGQHRFAVARGFLRAVLGQYLNIEPERIEFAFTPEGKPHLPPGSGQGLEFNLAHSRDLALCAVTRDHSIGIDVEYVHPLLDADQIVERFFAPREARLFQSVPPTEKQRVFFDAWTRKEACLKALGYGIARGLDTIEVTFLPGESARILAIDGDRVPAEQWSLEALTPAAKYVAAVAAPAKNMRFCHLIRTDERTNSILSGEQA